MDIKKVSIFIPAMNEEGNIKPLVTKIKTTIEKLPKLTFELIIVNDGSTDLTGIELEREKQDCTFMKVFHHRKNRGLTQAMRTGFKAVTGDVVVFLPADLESDPEEDIPALLSGFDNGFDMVCGWRQGRGDGKNFASGIYNKVSKKLFNVKIHDMNWIKAFKTEIIEDLELRSDWHRFIVMMAANKGYKIGEVRTNWYPRRAGKSKFGLMRFPIAVVDVLVVKFNMMFGSKPMQFFSFLGAMTFFLGLVGLFLLAVYYFLFDTQVRPLFTLATTLIIAGVQLFVTGFIAELIVSQKDELQRLKDKVNEIK